MDTHEHPDPYERSDPPRQSEQRPSQPRTGRTEPLPSNPYQQVPEPPQAPVPYQQHSTALASGTAPRKPDKVQAIAIMSLVDGILNMIWAVALIMGICTAPLGVYAAVVGVMAIVYASNLLSSRPRGVEPNKTLAIMQIANIVSGNVISLVIGILALVFYNDPEVEDYYRQVASQPHL